MLSRYDCLPQVTELCRVRKISRIWGTLKLTRYSVQMIELNALLAIPPNDRVTVAAIGQLCP